MSEPVYRRLPRRLLMRTSELLLVVMVLIILLPAFGQLYGIAPLVQEVMDVLVVIASYAFLHKGVKKDWVHVIGGASLFLALVVLLKPNNVLPVMEVLSEGMTTLLFIRALVHLFKVLFFTRQVNLQVIISAVSGYLALGLFWAVAAYSLERIVPGSYMDSNGMPLDRLGMTYYGFMAMTTVGFGDVEPISAPARALAILMAVSAQMYLAGVMAVLVGKFLEGPVSGQR